MVMDSSFPLLSVGIPVYNGEKYIGECLDSLLNQTFTDFDITICDNCSTDNTELICLDYQKKDNRIKYHRNESNIGITENYNRVFKLSKGKYFKWSSANDICLPTLFEKCIDILNSQPDVALCYTNTNIINGGGRVLKEYDNNLNLMQDNPVERLRKFFINLDMNNVMNGVFRRSVLAKTSLVAPYLASDINMLVEVCLLGKYYEIDEYLFNRRFDKADYEKIKNTKNLLKFYNSSDNSKIIMKFWRLNFEHTRSVLKSPLKLNEKIKLTYFLLKKLYYDRNILIKELWMAFKSIFS